MSPTDTMLTRIADLSGFGGFGDGGGSGSGASTVTGSGGGCGAGSGGVAHAASSSSAKRPESFCMSVVTESNSEYINLCRAQTTAQHVQFVKVVGRSYVNTMVVAVIDFYALDV